MSERIRTNTAAGSKGGLGGLFGFLWTYFELVIKWDVTKIIQPGNLEELVVGSVLAFLGVAGIAGWNRDKPSPVETSRPVEKTVIQAPSVPISVVDTPPPFVRPAPRKTYSWKLSRRSESNLATVHTDLQRLVRLALTYSPVDFGVTEGIRDLDRQRKLLAEGKSWTLNSRHLHGLAVDVVAYDGGTVTWDIEQYTLIAAAFERAGQELGIAFKWGGHWKTRDAVHFELDRADYPDRADVALA